MPLVIVSVKALVEDNNKYLFLKEKLHHGFTWDLPGGKIEYGEEPVAALLREVFEETSLIVEVGKLAGVWWFYSTLHRHQVICPTYICRPIGDIKLDFSENPADEHHIDYRWLSIKEVLQSDEVKLEPSLQKLLKEMDV